MIHIKELKKSFGNQTILDGITASISQREVVAILGSSGSGKSTLLRCLNSLERPCSGEVWVDGLQLNDTNLHRIRDKVGMVFQSFNLFSHMTVLRNLIYAPVQVQKISKSIATEKAMELLSKVGLSDKAGVFPHTLSGGQKQRVAIARALMMSPQVLLFDEPTSALDPEMVQEVLKVIRGLTETGMTLLVVTHEMSFVREVSSRVLFLDRGKILEDQRTEEFFKNTHNARVASFLNQPSL